MNKIAAALVSSFLLCAGSAVNAQDAMSKDAMSHDTMSKDAMSHDAMSKVAK